MLLYKAGHYTSQAPLHKVVTVNNGVTALYKIKKESK